MSEERWWLWVLFIGMGATTFFTRGAFLLPGDKLRLPRIVEEALRYAPVAALFAIIAPDLLLLKGSLNLSLDNPRLLGGIVALAIAIFTRNILLTIVAGMLTLTIARLFIA